MNKRVKTFVRFIAMAYYISYLKVCFAALAMMACMAGWGSLFTWANEPVVTQPAVMEVVDNPAPRIGFFSNDPIYNNGLYSKERVYLFDPKKWPFSRPVPPIPTVLDGKLYFQVEADRSHRYKCLKSGVVQALASAEKGEDLGQLGFARVEGQTEISMHGVGREIPMSLYQKEWQEGVEFTLPPGAVLTGFEVIRTGKNHGGEVLYNGIQLPTVWPPKVAWAGNAPMDPPYLAKPPKVIPIQVGRQLFVDDFLIEKSDLQREYHYPEKYHGNPVLKPETELEIKGRGRRLAAACPKSGGLWWNPDKQLFELWYEAGWLGTIAYATSKDGIHWERPPLQVNPPTNQVLAQNIVPDSWTVVKDYHASDPQQRFKIFVRRPGDPNRALGFVSKDGLDFGKPFDGGMCGDRSTMFYNPFRKVWVFSLRWGDAHGRVRYYAESDDFLAGIRWMPDVVVPWARTDRLDAPNPQIGDNPQLYNLDAVPYESIMLGFFQILHGPANEIGAAKGIPKSTGLNFAYSRDGFYWSRPDRTIAIDSTRQEGWDRGYVQSLGNICVIRGDKIWFYYTGFAGDTNLKTGDPGVKDSMSSGLYANGATGIATLRRDGFVSLNAQDKPGQVTTRMVSFPGKYLFVNADASQGGLIAEVLDAEGRVIEPYSAQNCVELKTNSTITQMRWKGGDDLSQLAQHPVRFRFTLTNAKLYAFWVSSGLNGRSDGYVAGGGPGYTSDVDTVGVAALESDKELFAAPIKALNK